jgi:malate synthase
VRHGVGLHDGPEVTPTLVRATIDEELGKIREDVGDEIFSKSRPDDARSLFEQVSLGDEFVEFLTLPAYVYLD